MKAYSEDVRERVLRALDQGYSQSEIAQLFGVSTATIKRYAKLRRETGSLHPQPIPGRPSHKFAPLQAGLVAQLEAHPHATCEEHCRLWEQEHGMQVGPSCYEELTTYPPICTVHESGSSSRLVLVVSSISQT